MIQGTLYQSSTNKEKELENIRAASEFYSLKSAKNESAKNRRQIYPELKCCLFLISVAVW